MRCRRTLGLAASAFLSLVSATIVSAEWPEDPAVNVPICTAPEDQSFRALAAVTDGAGGAIVAWDDPRDGTFDVYAQRVDVDGNIAWTSDGVQVGETSDVWGWNAEIAAVSDGSGGAIVVWIDDGGSDANIRAQRVDSSGSILWPDGAPSLQGVSICSADGDQMDLGAASDGNGGAYIVWTDTRDPSTRGVYVQRVDPNGFRQWILDGKPVVVHDGSYYQSEPAIAEDDWNGAVIVWTDGRNNPTTNHDIYAQRMTQNGVRLWNEAGRAVCEADYGQEEPVIVGTGSGGAIIAWLDHRDNMYSGIDVYAQRMRNDDGTPMWTPDGQVICDVDEDQQFLAIAGDGIGGAVIVWEDRRNAVATATDIYAQRVSDDGGWFWDDGGEAVCAADDDQFRPTVVPVGDSKWMVVWSDWRGDGAVVAQRYGYWGHREGPLNGLPVTLAPHYQGNPAAVAMGRDDEAIVAWSDSRSPSYDYDVYAQGDFFGIFRNAFESGDFDGWSDVVP